jgi:MFS family permease
VNSVVSTMIYSDLLVIGAEGFLTPLFPILVTTRIHGATLETVGLSLTLYWVVKSLLQLPIAKLVDSIPGEKDDFQFMFLGTILYALTPLMLLVADKPWHVFLFQGLLGAWAAFVFPTYSAIFTRHIDRHREGYEWSLHSLAIGLSYGGVAGIAGWIAQNFGFTPLIVLNTFVMLSGTFILLLAKHDIYRDGKEHNMKAREPDRNGRRVT